MNEPSKSEVGADGIEWRCRRDGLWYDKDGNPASDIESSLLDTILSLNNEKHELLSKISSISKHLSDIERLVTYPNATGGLKHGTAEMFRVMYPSIYRKISEMIEEVVAHGEQNDR